MCPPKLPSVPSQSGVAFAHGKSWKVLRQFSQLTMREFGMGKQSIEKQIQEEAQRLVEELQKSQGEPRGRGRGWMGRQGVGEMETERPRDREMQRQVQGKREGDR